MQGMNSIDQDQRCHLLININHVLEEQVWQVSDEDRVHQTFSPRQQRQHFTAAATAHRESYTWLLVNLNLTCSAVSS